VIFVGRVTRRRLAEIGRPEFQTSAADRRRASRRRWLFTGVGVALVGFAYLVGGPVAAIAVAAYALAAGIAWRGRTRRQRADRAYAELLDAIDGVAGDLRAGLTPDAALATTSRTAVRDEADAAIQAACARLDAAYRISEALGAPLADIIDRVDADLRATRRARATVEAQTAGAQATSTLLAALPLAGLGLGAGMGADPVYQLLRTPVGAACGLSAVALQCAGLAWTARLIRGAVEAVR
jgi:tight adherence protein B